MVEARAPSPEWASASGARPIRPAGQERLRGEFRPLAYLDDEPHEGACKWELGLVQHQARTLRHRPVLLSASPRRHMEKHSEGTRPNPATLLRPVPAQIPRPTHHTSTANLRRNQPSRTKQTTSPLTPHSLKACDMPPSRIRGRWCFRQLSLHVPTAQDRTPVAVGRSSGLPSLVVRRRREHLSGKTVGRASPPTPRTSAASATSTAVKTDFCAAAPTRLTHRRPAKNKTA